MLAERYKRHRYEVGKAEGKAEAKAQERARNSKYIARLSAWYEERIEAVEKGEPFGKPRPQPDDEEDDKTL